MGLPSARDSLPLLAAFTALALISQAAGQFCIASVAGSGLMVEYGTATEQQLFSPYGVVRKARSILGRRVIYICHCLRVAVPRRGRWILCYW